jgi:Plasmid recombination enzyme
MSTNLIDSSFNYVIRIESIGVKVGLLPALKHNKRTLYEEIGKYPDDIDPKRVVNNYSLVNKDSPEEILVTVNRLLDACGITRIRKNQIMGIEIVFSLPKERFNQDTRQFFTDACEWVKKSIDGVLISFDVHLDQSAPHAHAIVLPLLDGKLNASKIMGNRSNIAKIVSDFHDKVACYHGMSKFNKLSAATKKEVVRNVFEMLGSDPVKSSMIWIQVKKAIEDNPIPYAYQLGISVTVKKKATKKQKSFVKIMTSKGKGSEKHDREELKNSR